MKKEHTWGTRLTIYVGVRKLHCKQHHVPGSPLAALLTAVLLCVSASAGRAQSNGTEFNLKTDFGAVGDGQTNDSPALQAALDALAQAGGGTLLVPPGRYALASPVNKNFFNQASSIIIRGVGSSSQFLIKSGNGTRNIELGGLERLVLSGLIFVGTPGVRDDATIALFLSYCAQVNIEYCDFYGISTISTPGGAVVYSHNSDLRIRNSAFRGCTGNSAIGNSVVYANQWLGVSVSDTDFIDYGTLNGVGHSKTPLSLTYAWVSVGTPLSLDAVGQNLVQLRGVRMDEGSWIGFACVPGGVERVAQVRLSALRINVSSAALGAGVVINRANQVVIDQSWMGYNTGARSAIRLTDAGNVTITSVQASKGNNGELALEADAATRLTIVDSSFDTINTAPETTLILKDWAEGFQLAAAAAASADASVNGSRAAPMKAPAGPNDPIGSVGDMTWDENYVYVKTSTGWKRTALGSW